MYENNPTRATGVDRNPREVHRNPPKVTAAFLCVFTTVYVAELLVAGSFSANAAHQTALAIHDATGNNFALFSWLLHSSHSHFVWNIASFGIAGWWVESRVDTKEYAFGVAGLLGLFGTVAGVVVAHQLGAGINGITAGLWVMVGATALDEVWSQPRQNRHKLIIFGFAVFAVANTVGLLGPLPAGTAVGVHIAGTVLGLLWYIANPGESAANPVSS